jgi:hypothetical protein
MTNTETLRELHAAATPGPWTVGERPNQFWHIGAGMQAIATVLHEGKKGSTAAAKLFKANADYIVAACNAVPALLDENKALREALVATRHVLEAANTQPDGPICDTIWYSGCETLFDFIDVALTKGQPS